MKSLFKRYLVPLIVVSSLLIISYASHYQPEAIAQFVAGGAAYHKADDTNGFAALTVPSGAAVSFVAADIDTTGHDATTRALFQVKTNDVLLRYDGTAAATGVTGGFLILAGGFFTVQGSGNIVNCSFFGEGGTATVVRQFEVQTTLIPGSYFP